MIPDKIFLGIGPMSGDEPDKRYLYAEWYEEPKPLVKNIAYIRKDALLEWVKACYDSMRKNDAISELFKQGALYELHKVINKLNSM